MESITRGKFACSWLLMSAATVVWIAGCSGGDDKWTKGRPPVYKASGKVMYKGEALGDATVLYFPTTGDVSAFGKTDAEGKFVLTTFKENDGAPAGSYKVVVTKIEYKVVPTAYNSPEENAVVHLPKQMLPKKYSKKETTDLTAEVTAKGPNEAVIEVPE